MICFNTFIVIIILIQLVGFSTEGWVYQPCNALITIFQEDDWDLHRLDCGLTQRYLKNTAEFLMDTIELPDKSILDTISRYDASETLNIPGAWPRSYSTLQTSCPKCCKELAPLSKKRQRLKSDKQVIISKRHILVVDIYIRKCKKCYLILSPDTLKHGLLNIGDVTLVSLDVFFTLRNTVR